MKPSVEEVKRKKRNGIHVVLDNIRSMYNVGAIFRTSDGCLVEKIHLCGITAVPPRKEISKTALDADEVVPYEHYEDTLDAIKELKSKGVKVYAVELSEESVLYSDCEYQFPAAFVFGHEVLGVSDEVMELVDGSVYLPMLGRANSLNVSVCFGIVAYDALRKLHGKA